MKDEALKLALEALEYTTTMSKFLLNKESNIGPILKAEKAITAIKQALAEPVQEPVACKTLCELCVKRGYNFCANAVKTTPIPTPPAQPTPVQQKPLFAEIIAKHPGLAEELKAMDAEPEKGKI